MQLELKHLAPYLPFKVKVRCCLGKGSIWTLRQFNIAQFSYYDKLILRPLSDLTKEVEHNGERFVPNDKLLEFYGEEIDNYSLPLKLNSYILIQQLFEWHFDVFGLIEKGLAIDINTLKLNINN